MLKIVVWPKQKCYEISKLFSQRKKSRLLYPKYNATLLCTVFANYGCYVKILSNTFIHFILDVYCYKYVTMDTMLLKTLTGFNLSTWWRKDLIIQQTKG